MNELTKEFLALLQNSPALMDAVHAAGPSARDELFNLLRHERASSLTAAATVLRSLADEPGIDHQRASAVLREVADGIELGTAWGR